MYRSKHVQTLIPVMIITLACISSGSRAASMTGVASENDPKTYKIDIAQNDVITISINERNITDGCSVLVALALGLNRNLGDTLILAGDVVNSTHNATITWTHNASTPLYLIVYVLECSNNSVLYDINSTHPFIEYPYNQYYADVVLPEVVPRIAFLGIALGFIALVITAYLVKRRRTEKAATGR